MMDCTDPNELAMNTIDAKMVDRYRTPVIWATSGVVLTTLVYPDPNPIVVCI